MNSKPCVLTSSPLAGPTLSLYWNRSCFWILPNCCQRPPIWRRAQVVDLPVSTWMDQPGNMPLAFIAANHCICPGTLVAVQILPFQKWLQASYAGPLLIATQVLLYTSPEGVSPKGHSVNGVLPEALKCNTKEPYSSMWSGIVWRSLAEADILFQISFFSPITSCPLLCAYKISLLLSAPCMPHGQVPALWLNKTWFSLLSPAPGMKDGGRESYLRNCM